jgi:hypothetical protein
MLLEGLPGRKNIVVVQRHQIRNCDREICRNVVLGKAFIHLVNPGRKLMLDRVRIRRRLSDGK